MHADGVERRAANLGLAPTRRMGQLSLPPGAARRPVDETGHSVV